MAKSLKAIQSIRGMTDLLPERSSAWSCMEKKIFDILTMYSFEEIRTPIVENTNLFQRSIGEITDIIEKEMYSFPDRNNELLSLRPEGTAGCVRAAIESGLLNTPRKFYYSGPMFRYEKPQKGRHRQFHQIGGEVFGYSSVNSDAELIIMNHRFWDSLGLLDNIKLIINNIGSSESREKYKAVLVEYLSDYKSSLNENDLSRLKSNPLRILDSKDRNIKSILKNAPCIVDYVSTESVERQDKLLEILKTNKIGYEINSSLVRGLDYYNDTVFEWVSDNLGAQGTVCAGGRYDNLVEKLGGKSTPAVGFAIGLERLFLLLEVNNFSSLNVKKSPDICIIVSKEEFHQYAFTISEDVYNRFPILKISHDFSNSTIKSQFKRADKIGAKLVFIIGEEEVKQNSISVKNLRTGEQSKFYIDQSKDKFFDFLSKTI